jgi:hypothetical protein
MPDREGVSVNLALGRKAVFGIQYCGTNLCSQTSLLDVVSKMVEPARTPRMRFCTLMIFGRYSALGLKSLAASSVILMNVSPLALFYLEADRRHRHEWPGKGMVLRSGEEVL